MIARPTRVLVVGGGTMGLASAWVLARRGVHVDVVERFEHVHERGSHSGHTRVIRQAYHEGANYVPLVQEADREWVALGERTGLELLVRTGLVEFGPADHPDFVDSIHACEVHRVAHDVVDATTAMQRWPLAMPPDWRACFTPSGGWLRVGACFDALRREAQAAGARFHYGAQVREIAGEGITLADGTRHAADAVVVTAGAWLPELLPALLPGTLTRVRRVLLWFAPTRDLSALPVWCAFDPAGFFYGFPPGDEGIGGLKIARHMTREPGPDDRPVDPDTVDRTLHHGDVDPVRAFVQSRMPAARGEVVAHRVCLYTLTPSSDFVIDRVPGDPRIVVAGGFSGHGFKFAPAIGRLVADLTLDGDTLPLQQFSLARHRA